VRAAVGSQRSAIINLLPIIWLGAALRFQSLFANTFHVDEALFAQWARLIAVWRDPLLLTQAVDKPPLLFYLQALFYPLFGPVEWAARLPSFIASILLIPLTARLAWRLTGDRTAALTAAFIVAVAPLTIQFSATAFSDSLLTFWLMAALYAVARPRVDNRQPPGGAALAGLLFGLAVATKYQALLFAPLVVGVGWLAGRRRGDWLGSLGGLAAVLVALLLWQWARPSSAGLVALQWANIGGLRPAHSWELWPRALETVRLWGVAAGWPLVGIGVLTLGLVVWFRRGRHRIAPVESLLILFVSGYMLLHWLWAVPVWDRYLLPIFPLVALLGGRAISCALAAVSVQAGRRPVYAAAIGLIVLVSMPAALAARQGGFPIGGQPAADGGAARVARLLKDAPYGTVLYDHWYSWHWQYHLFDGRVFVSWFPHVDALLADLAVFSGNGADRYVALPSSMAAAPVARRLAADGYVLESVDGQDEAASMILYRIIGSEIAR
jgi:4-amino-4-deoxy-L-arabinose transferase-like glycosyltransferase